MIDISKLSPTRKHLLLLLLRQAVLQRAHQWDVELALERVAGFEMNQLPITDFAVNVHDSYAPGAADLLDENDLAEAFQSADGTELDGEGLEDVDPWLLEERSNTIRRVMQKCYDETDAWEVPGIGSTLAYLALAISKGEQVDLWARGLTASTLKLLRKHFQPHDLVWRYVNIRKD